MDFAQALQAELDSAPVVDPHTHLRASRPEADNLADLVLYHHVWVELVSAGMPITATTKAGLPHELADPGMEPVARVRAALPYLRHLRSTTSGYLLRTLLADLYGVPGGELTEGNVEQVAALVSELAADPAWREQVLRDRAKIEVSLTVDARGPAVEGIAFGAEQNLNLVSGKQGPREMLQGMERALGTTLRTADDLEGAMRKLGGELAARPLQFVGLWLLPYFCFEQVGAREITSLLIRAADGKQLARAELGAFTAFAARSFLEGMRAGGVRTIQVIVGAEVLPPHRAL